MCLKRAWRPMWLFFNHGQFETTFKRMYVNSRPSMSLHMLTFFGQKAQQVFLDVRPSSRRRKTTRRRCGQADSPDRNNHIRTTPQITNYDLLWHACRFSKPDSPATASASKARFPRTTSKGKLGSSTPTTHAARQ